MASSKSFCCLFLALVVLLSASPAAYGQLSTSFYATDCPSLESIVRSVVSSAVASDPRMGASLVRLFFHDCFVQGCDASILLDDVPVVIDGEKTAFPNVNSVRGYEVIDSIKTAVENANCTTVSCADIVALPARDGTVLLRIIFLCRWVDQPGTCCSAGADVQPEHAHHFVRQQGPERADMTALSGAHTFGFTQCENFRARIYNDTNINGQFAKQRQGGCPAALGSGDANLAPLDVTTQDAFDNAFYANLLLKKKGLPHSDQELYNGGSQDKLVRQYAYDQAFFFADFVTAMINMGNISPLTGTAGQTGTTAEWLINCCCCYISCFDRVSEDTCMQPSSSTVVTEKEHVSCTI